MLLLGVAGVVVVAVPTPASALDCTEISDCLANDARGSLAALVGVITLVGLIFAPEIFGPLLIARGAVEGFTGDDVITGEPLDWKERAIGLVPVGGAAAKEVTTLVRAEREIALVARLEREVAEAARLQREAASVSQVENQAAKLIPYKGPGGGHHVPAKSAFGGDPIYNANKALAIPNAEMEALGVSHSAITGAQMTGYRAFASTGKTLGWADVSTIETNALIRGGMSPSMAEATVNQAIDALKQAGVSGPTRIPWGR